MTQDEIIKMARESGFVEKDAMFRSVYLANIKDLEAFAKLVAERERELCAKVCENGINNATDWDSSVWDQACENRAFAIRARGQE